MRTTDTTAQLVELSQPELVGTFDDHGVGIGDVDPVLDDGRTHEDVYPAVVEVRHDLAEFAFRHLAVADPDTRARCEFGDFVSGTLDGAHLVVYVEDLATAGQFPGDGFADDRTPLLHDEGLDRQSPGRRGGDDGQVADAGKRQVEGAWNRRRGECQDIHFGAQVLQLFLLANAEPVLLVDDHEAEVLERERLAKQTMGADDDVHLARGEPLGHGVHVAVGTQT